MGQNANKLVETITGTTTLDAFPWILIATVVVLIIYSIYQHMKARNAWMEAISSLADDIDSIGGQIIEDMVKIAQFSAKTDGEEGYRIGFAHSVSLSKKSSPTFHKELLTIIQDIKVASSGKNLNGAYNSTKDVLIDIEALLKKYSYCKKNFENFGQLSIDINDIKKRLTACSDALSLVRAKLYPLEETPDEDAEG